MEEDPIIKKISVELNNLFMKDIKNIIMNYYSFACDICEKEVCLNFNDECKTNKCHFAIKNKEPYFCMPFLCSKCGKIICEDCGMECLHGCKKEFCKQCSAECELCGTEVCNSCIKDEYTMDWVEGTHLCCYFYNDDPYGFGANR